MILFSGDKLLTSMYTYFDKGMKFLFTLLLALSATGAFSQDKLAIGQEIRQGIAGEILSFKIPPTPVARIQNLSVWNGSDSVRVRLYYPDSLNKKHPVIYQIHGGALVGGDLETHDNICRLLALKTSSIVVAVDYRKPPEAPYPAGLNDCLTVLDWIEKTAASWNGDKKRLTLVGDSGGGLLVTSLLVQKQGKIPFRKIVLINPAVDLRNAEEGMYGMVAQMYLNGKSPNDPLVSPVLAPKVSFSPPTLIITCEKDILKPQGEAWFTKLQKANVVAKIVDIPNADHLGGLWAACHPEAKQAIDATIQFINAVN